MKQKIKESEEIELKKSTAQLKKGVISISSILNKHQKGELYFGIKDDGTIIGQDISAKTLRDISNEISNNIEPEIYPEINKEKLNGKNYIHLKFKGDKTLYYAYGKAYIRVADVDKPLHPKEIEDMIINKNLMYWDNQLSERNISDANTGLIRQYIKRANEAGRLSFKYENAKTTLNKLDLTKKNKILNAGQVLFCNKNPLELQLAIFAGVNKNKFLDIKLFKGNGFYLLEESELYIKQHMKWEVEIKSLRREEIPEIPLPAIREALVNSFCHRDYNRPEGNEIAIFENRIEIYNPGSFPDGHNPQDYFTGKERSILRNPIIAQILYY